MEKRFQWSKFVAEGEQYVIREDDWKLFEEGVEKVLARIKGVGVTSTTSKKDAISDRVCPKDGGKLINSVTKTGKKIVKCENNKWDATQRKAVGCEFVEWPEMTNADM